MGSFTGGLTGGLFDPSTPNYARLASQSEKKRQGIINLGMQQIGAVYGGGAAPFYSLANTGQNKFNPHSDYYYLGKSGEFAPYWAPGAVSPGSQTNIKGPLGVVSKTGGGDPIAKAILGGIGFEGLFGDTKSPREVAAQKFKRGQLFNAPDYQSFEGFQPEFFQKRAQDYINYALPQEAQQYRDTRNALTYGLANKGLADSSVATQTGANLERTAGQAKQGIADTAISQANQLQQDVEESRQKSIAQLYQSADPAQAFQSAISAAGQFQRPSTFAPIGNLFNNLAQQYYTNQTLNNYRLPQYGTAPNPTYNLAGALGPTTY